MREIKFRGKRVDGSNEWAYGHYAFMSLYGDKPVHRIIWHDEGGAEHNVIIDPATRGEYIGLTDKAGRDIYEHDVVRVGGQIGEVEYDRYAFTVKDFYRSSYDIPSDAFSEGLDECEIIGNTIDNPELLGGGV